MIREKTAMKIDPSGYVRMVGDRQNPKAAGGETAGSQREVTGALGKGMAAGHLRHAPGSQIAEINYLDHAHVDAATPIVSPREIGGVA